jgi:hypothetical protein
MLRAAFALVVVSAVARASDYERTLERLSDPAEARWQHFAAPYFSTNEKLLNRFYPRFDGLGGVTVGVSFQQNLSLLVHARPELSVIFDYNPGLTEVLVPFMGDVLKSSPTRREFLGTLLGADFREGETKDLLSGSKPVAGILTTVLERTEAARRKIRLDELRVRLLAHVPARATPYARSETAKWIDILETEELLTGAFFSDAVAGGGWLSTEENYALVRKYWLSGRIIGVTGDISGPSVAKLGEFLRAKRLEVTGIYLSNVGISTEGHFPESWFRDLYHRLGTEMPVTPNALTLIAQGPWELTGYVRTLKQAIWVYDRLADVPEEIAIRLHEAPLEILVQLGPSQLIPALRKGLAALHTDPGYALMLDRLEAGKSADLEKSPGVDPRSPVYKAIYCTLVEAGRLRAQ